MTLRSSLQRIGHLPIALACFASLMTASSALGEEDLDGQVRTALGSAGFTGTIQSQFLPALGRTSGAMLTQLPTSACLICCAFMTACPSGLREGESIDEAQAASVSASAAAKMHAMRRVHIWKRSSCREMFRL